MDQPWRIELFGWLRAVQGDRVVSRFRTRRAEALLAYLAYHSHRSHPREQLIELLWPEGDPSAGRCSLSTELTSLRRQLEPPGVPTGAVLVATRTAVQLNPDACFTDVARFEVALQAARRTAGPAERARQLTAAAELYQGELLPGGFEDWILPERLRLAEAFLQALHELVELLEELGDVPGALQWARRAVAADPLDEECHLRLIRLLLATGQVEAAHVQYEQGEHLLQELGSGLSPEIHALIKELAPSKDRLPSAPAGLRGKRCRTAAGPDPELLRARSAASPRIDEGAQTALPLHPSGADARPSDNLPLRFTRFFGREAEIEQLCQAVGCRLSAVQEGTPAFTDGRQPTADSPRLITLTGPGGTGKTRLALQAAQQFRDAFPGGVWFVSLRDLTDPALIPDQLLLALRLPRAPQSEALEQAMAFLVRAPSLLLLDNFEHLVDGGAEIVQKLLQQVEHLAVMVTSRQRLSLEGEREFPVAPLPTPPDGPWRMVDGPTRTDLSDPSEPSTIHPQRSPWLECASVQLFVDRAQAARPDFQITKTNAAAVAGLCQRLEGLPLAIELAAARANMLTPQQMLARLEQRFALLVGRQRAADPRHRSLRAALDWSYQLLTPELQRFFVCLSVFRGGWTLEAAAAVCEADVGRQALGVGKTGSDPTPNAQRLTPALDCLEELQRCSLAVTEAVGEEMRYRLLETLREYGAELLAAEERTALARRHLAYYMSWFHHSMPKTGGRTLKQYLDETEREQDNLRAALDWMVESGAAVDWMLTTKKPWWEFIPNLAYYWKVRGYTAEGRRRLAEILALPGAEAPTTARAWLLSVAGQLAQRQGDFAAAGTLFLESMMTYRELGNEAGELECCGFLAALARGQGDYARARSFYEPHLAVAREIGAESEIARDLDGMGYTAFLEGDLETGQSLLEEALRILRNLSDQAEKGVAWTCPYLCEQTAAAGDDYPAHASLKLSTGWICAHRGEIADARGDYAAAHAYLEESLAIFQEFGNLFDAASTLHKLGRVAQHRSQWSAAAAHFSESLAFWQQDGNKQGIAACLDGLAAVASGQGKPERAARLLGAAAALRESRNVPVPPVERADLDRVMAGVRASHGEEALAAAWAAGQAMPLDQIIDEALQEVPAG